MNIIQIPRRFVESDWGGTETVILETSRQLLSLGHETKIMTSMALAQRKAEQIRGVTVERFGYFYPYLGLSKEKKTRLDHKGGNLFSFSLMNALSRERGVDLLHLHTAKRLGGIVRKVAQQKSIPYVVSVHGGLFDVPTKEAAGLLEPTKGKFEYGKALGWWVGSRDVFNDASAILCVGLEEFHQMKKHYPRKRIVHLPNGVDCDRFEKGDEDVFRKAYGIPKQKKIILTIGRIDPQKNQKGAVNAFANLRNREEAHLVLIGHVTHQAYHGELLREIEERGLQDSVTLIPGISAADPQLVNALHAASVFLLPSIHEPFGIVLLEAWAAGLPIVASNVGGIPSFVEHQVNGLLCDPADATEFATALELVFDHPDQASQFAEAGKRKATEQFSWNTVTKSLVAVYEEVAREYSHPQ